ncbi:MAG: sugar phosphate isomerase/epimerase [Ruminococcaceae bacterium]|nr:sugar phosphate isomerase/epimerase [Oscillospiraceae bacterium]
MVNLKLSAFADEYADSFEEQLMALERFGIKNLEVRHLNGKNISVLPLDEVKDAKRMLDASGIRVSAIGSPLGKIRLDGDIKAHIETARRIFESANILGAPFVRVFSFYAPEGKSIADMKGEVLDALERLVMLARAHGITLCHENEAKIYGDIPSREKELLDHFSGELKCVFDMGNFVLEGIDPYPEAYDLLKKDIAYFHIKDALFQGAIVPAGKGEAKIKEILSAHRDYAQEDFFVSLEPHLQTFAGLNALVGRSFTNPYQYADQKAAFGDAVEKFKELI